MYHYKRDVQHVEKYEHPSSNTNIVGYLLIILLVFCVVTMSWEAWILFKEKK